MMEFTVLTNSDLRVSRLCIGGDPMGGHAWGPTNDEELMEAVNVAVDQGINFFDTADIYGLGKAETLLGKALGGRKNDVVIASKFGVRRNEIASSSYYDNSPSWITTAIKGTLRRLGRDYIDVYQLHWRDGKTPIADVVECLEKLRETGYVRYFGLSNISLSDMEELLPYAGKFVSFQDQYSLAYRDSENSIIELSKRVCMTPLTWGSLGQGILTGKYDKNVVFDNNDRRSRATYPNFHGEKLLKNLEIVDHMRAMGAVCGKEPPAIAIRFILDHLPDSVVIVGVKRKQQVLSNVQSMGWSLSPGQLQELESISL